MVLLANTHIYERRCLDLIHKKLPFVTILSLNVGSMPLSLLLPTTMKQWAEGRNQLFVNCNKPVVPNLFLIAYHVGFGTM